MRPFFVWTLLLLSYVSVADAKLQENPTLEAADCSSIPSKEYCNSLSHDWCVWSDDFGLCQSNYDPILFINLWDTAALPRSLITYAVVTGCMMVYWLSGVLVRYMFRRVHGSEYDTDKLDKCQLYLFELIGLTYCLAVMSSEGGLDVIFYPEKFLNVSPQQMLELTRSFSGAVVLCYMYAIEMLVSNLRWSLKLHHVVTISIIVYWLWLLDDFFDLAGYRVGLTMMLYAFSEHNVFAQLLLYRFAPLFCWQLHFASAVVFVVTRVFVVATVVYCFVDWALTDNLKNQLNGTQEAHSLYLVGFFLIPIGNILLNYAQFQTVKALFYVSKSVKSRAEERHAMLTYPRLQQLYDLFIEFDSNGEGYWDMSDFKRFIFYHSTFIKQDTVLILWSVLGFSAQTTGEATDGEDGDADDAGDEHVQTDQVQTLAEIVAHTDDKSVGIKRKQWMRWKDVKMIFGEHVQSEKFRSYSLRQLIGAQLQVLIESVFAAQSQFTEIQDLEEKKRASKQLYSDVNGLIDSKRSKALKHERMQSIENVVATASGKQLHNVHASDNMDLHRALELGNMDQRATSDTAHILNGNAVERQLKRNSLIQQTFAIGNFGNLPLIPDSLQVQATV